MAEEETIRLADIEALIQQTAEQAKVERERLTELHEIRAQLEWLKQAAIERKATEEKIMQGINSIAQYLGALAAGDRQAMRRFAQEAKEVTVEVQSGGVRAEGNVEAGQDVMGRDQRTGGNRVGGDRHG